MLLAIVSSLVAIISPFWGLIFWTVNICDLLRKKAKDINIGFLVFGIVSLVAVIGMKIDFLRAADVVIGIGISSYLFIILYHKGPFARAFSFYGLFQLAYAFVRKYLFANHLLNSKEIIIKQIEINRELFQNYQNIEAEYLKMIDYYFQNIELFWIIPMVFAFVSGLILTRKNLLMKFHVIAYKLPDNFIYLMMLGIILAIFKETRFIGLPITITFVTLLTIEGFPIVWLWLLGSTFNNTLLRILTYIIILLNFHVFIIISAIVGLIDIWFNLKNGVKK